MERWGCDVCNGYGFVFAGEGSPDPQAYTGGTEPCPACGCIRDGGSRGLAWTLTMLVMPYFLIVAVAFYWFVVIAGEAQAYQGWLHAVFPGSWFGGQASPVAITAFAFAAVVATVTGLFLVRRHLCLRWARGSAGMGTLRASCFVVSFAAVLVLVLGPGLVLVAGAMVEATSPAPEIFTLRAWPVILTLLTALWWSTGTTRRAVRRAARKRVAGWHQIDETWPPPDASLPPPGTAGGS
jgi:hypothetical protein